MIKSLKTTLPIDMWSLGCTYYNRISHTTTTYRHESIVHDEKLKATTIQRHQWGALATEGNIQTHFHFYIYMDL